MSFIDLHIYGLSSSPDSKLSSGFSALMRYRIYANLSHRPYFIELKPFPVILLSTSIVQLITFPVNL